jgi:AraC-like DNA-binding protein
MASRLAVLTDLEWENIARKNDFDLEAMAAACGVDLRQLQRFFGEHFGVTPAEWRRELRARIGASLLLQGWSTKAVAAELHYTSSSQLCHEFRSVHGVAPGAFCVAKGRPRPENVAYRQ